MKFTREYTRELRRLLRMYNEFHEISLSKDGVLIIAQSEEFIQELTEELKKLGVEIKIIHQSLCG